MAAWLHGVPHPALMMLTLAMPVLCAARSLRGGQTSNQRVLSGFFTGMALTATICFMPLVCRVTDRIKQRSGLEEKAFGDIGAEWRMEATRPVAQPKFQFERGPHESHYVILRGKPLMGGVLYRGAALKEISWRGRNNGMWSEWAACEGMLQGEDVASEWVLSWSCVRDAMGSMTDGELRVRAALTMETESTQTIPVQTGAFATGPGWTWEVLHRAERENNWGFYTAFRRACFAPNGRLVAEGSRRRPLSSDGLSGRPVSEWGQFAFVSTALHQHSLYSLESKKGEPEQPVVLRYVERSETFEKVIHVTGVSLTMPDSPALGPDVVREVTDTKRQPASRAGQPVHPWPAMSEEAVPLPDAEAAAVAHYLHRLVAGERCSDTAALAALVPRRLSLFLEMEVRHQVYGIRQALIAGAPEERRDEILRRIPDSSSLIEVAARRGWTAEAKPWVLQLMQRLDWIPPQLLKLCRGYRDPAFHAAMKPSFDADMETVEYWESMPDLAPELPARLEEAKRKLLASGILVLRDERTGTFLHRGDTDVLDAVLREWHQAFTDNGAGLLRKFLRTADGQLVPGGRRELVDVIGRSARDYTFDPQRHCFFKKPGPPAP